MLYQHRVEHRTLLAPVVNSSLEVKWYSGDAFLLEELENFLLVHILGRPALGRHENLGLQVSFTLRGRQKLPVGQCPYSGA